MKIKVEIILIVEHDAMLDEFSGLLRQSKDTDKTISDEIRIQMPMLQNLENQIDKVQSKVKRVGTKFNQYLEKSSNTCLMTAVCLQVLLLIVILLVF